MSESEPSTLGSATVGLRFLLEVVAVGILAYWGYSVGQSQLLKVGLGIGVALVVVVVWGLLGSPAAPYRLEQPWRLVLETVILGSAALAIYLVERPVLAVLFALVAAVNTGLLYVLDLA